MCIFVWGKKGKKSVLVVTHLIFSKYVDQNEMWLLLKMQLLEDYNLCSDGGLLTCSYLLPRDDFCCFLVHGSTSVEYLRKKDHGCMHPQSLYKSRKTGS